MSGKNPDLEGLAAIIERYALKYEGSDLILDRRRAMVSAAKSLRATPAAFDSSDDGISMDYAAAARRITGYPRLVAVKASEVLHKEFLESCSAAAAAADEVEYAMERLFVETTEDTSKAAYEAIRAAENAHTEKVFRIAKYNIANAVAAALPEDQSPVADGNAACSSLIDKITALASEKKRGSKVYAGLASLCAVPNQLNLEDSAEYEAGYWMDTVKASLLEINPATPQHPRVRCDYWR